MTTTEVSKKHNCSPDAIRNIIKDNDIELRKTNFKYIIQYLDDKIINTFAGSSEAAKWVEANNLTNAKLESIVKNIRRCCKKENNFTYGYYWKYKE